MAPGTRCGVAVDAGNARRADGNEFRAVAAEYVGATDAWVRASTPENRTRLDEAHARLHAAMWALDRGWLVERVAG